MASFLAGLLGKGAGEGVGTVVNAVGGTLDKLFTSDDERLTHGEVMERLKQQPDAAQAVVNLAEASHRAVFVAGWRPFIGWVSGTALAYNFIFRDLLVWGFSLWAPTAPVPPALQMDELMTVLLGLLGLGTLRTVEKIGRVAR
jgi:hypothetical protein